MFNLYQNQALTKEIIISKQLHLCRLAFSLCIRRGDQYVTVSDSSYSSIIEESKFCYLFFALFFILIFLFSRENDYSISDTYSNIPADVNVGSSFTIHDRLR